MVKCDYCNNVLVPCTRRLPWDEVLFDSMSYVVTPSLGSFIEGWTLIISKRHVTSMSQLLLSEIRELNSLMPEIRKRVEQAYGPTVVFEHGPLTAGTEFGCGIDHAHFHVVPFNDHIIPLIERELTCIKWRQLEQFEDILQERKSYLFVVDIDAENGIISNPGCIQSQFMRRILAKYMGVMEYFDYHQYSFEENASATCRSLRGAFNCVHAVGC